MSQEKQTDSGFMLKLLRSFGNGDVASISSLVACSLQAHLDWFEKHHGDRLSEVFMIEFPSLGKYFDMCISRQEVLEPPFLVRCHVDPDFPTLGLVDSIPIIDCFFAEDGGLRGHTTSHGWDLDPNRVFMCRQVLYMFKKFVKPCPKDMVVEAVREFWSIDQGLRTPRSIDNCLLYHVCGGEYAEGLTGSEPSALKRMVAVMDKLARWLAPVCDLDYLDLIPGHGPGAVSDLSRVGDKYTFPHYSSLIDEAFPAAYFCSPNWRLSEPKDITRYKYPAKLIAVPKTLDKPRLIASEPVVHQYLQQGLMRWLRNNMSAVHRMTVDFSDQDPSREAALRGSSRRSNATVDLSAASDRLSTWVVESHFQSRPYLLDALLRTRSNSLFDPILSGEVRYLRKFAPMGSAVTFPVQSLVYANACLAAGLVWEGRDKRLTIRDVYRLAKRVRVFGDDLVLPKDHLPYLALLLQWMELKINSSKTHYLGGFRESCGMDAWNGNDVTPAYISHRVPSRPGATLAAYVEQSNNAHRKGLWHLASEMLNLIPDEIRGQIPISHESLGVIASYTYVSGTTHRRVRFNTNLHRWEVKGYTLNPRDRVKKRLTATDLLQYFLEKPAPHTKWTAGYRIVGSSKTELEWVDARAVMR